MTRTFTPEEFVICWFYSDSPQGAAESLSRLLGEKVTVGEVEEVASEMLEAGVKLRRRRV